MNMKKYIAVLTVLILTITMFFSVKAADDIDIDVSENGTKTLTVADMAGKYKTQGRTSIINNNLSLDYTASGLEFNAYCAGDVSVTFNVASVTTGVGGGVYFTVYVDNATDPLPRAQSLITVNGDSSLAIATGLAEGNHNFKIYRNTEIERAIVGFKSVTLQGDLTAKPADKSLFIEFVGDSITTGFGNIYDASNGADPKMPINQDGTKTYAFLAAQRLNADFSMVAQQGIGAYTGWQTHNTITAYPCTRYWYDKLNPSPAPWDFAKQPNIVVINLGTNDISRYGANGKSLPDVKTHFSDLLSLVRQKNPKAKIVWAHGMMTRDADLEAMIPQVISEAGGAAQGYYHVLLSQNNAGGGSHPNAAGHDIAANELKDFITNTVLSVTHKPGDINGDGSVGFPDITILSRYIAGWANTGAKLEFCNINGDHDSVSGAPIIDYKDITLLSRFIAGWNVEIY